MKWSIGFIGEEGILHFQLLNYSLKINKLVIKSLSSNKLCYIDKNLWFSNKIIPEEIVY